MIRWTTPVSRERITYQTEHVGTTQLRRVIVKNSVMKVRFTRGWLQKINVFWVFRDVHPCGLPEISAHLKENLQISFILKLSQDKYHWRVICQQGYKIKLTSFGMRSHALLKSLSVFWRILLPPSLTDSKFVRNIYTPEIILWCGIQYISCPYVWFITHVDHPSRVWNRYQQWH